ncbi:MAG: hypothetical protein EB076_09120, partial [Flavobacteriia bacterium]|nr:hypothetical protein [Flavobacteriia bacterium]
QQGGDLLGVLAGGGVSEGLPQETVSGEEADGMGMIAALVKVGFAKSNGEARRLIRGGGSSVPASRQSVLRLPLRRTVVPS